jgi:hypothetical protein
MIVDAIRNYEYIRMLRNIYIYAMRIPLNIMQNDPEKFKTVLNFKLSFLLFHF